MALSDIICSGSSLIYLAITLLFVSFVAFYFFQRIQEQNHKIASMVELATTMANELNFIKQIISPLVPSFQHQQQQHQQQQQQVGFR
jgi:predicted PurR-regulated permease PerM